MSWDRITDWLLTQDADTQARGLEYFRIVRENIELYYSSEPQKSSGSAEARRDRDLACLDGYVERLESSLGRTG